jgi:hypothetical protein
MSSRIHRTPRSVDADQFVSPWRTKSRAVSMNDDFRAGDILAIGPLSALDLRHVLAVGER